MNPSIQANQRLTYLKELKSARELHHFIQYLDHKYGVDSTDPDNTFGRINLNQPIVQHGVDNTLYFAGINTINPEDLSLPKHKAIPHANSLIVLNRKTGDVSLTESAAHITAERIPVVVSDQDISELKRLRKNFKTEIQENKPKIPHFKNLENHGFVDSHGKHIPFKDLKQHQKRHVCDRILREQGFADAENHTIHVKLNVPDVENNPQPFKVKYYCLGSNKTPHFSTSYNGWQSQDDMDKGEPAYAFYQKWDVFHLKILTLEEWNEMKADLDELVDYYKTKD